MVVKFENARREKNKSSTLGFTLPICSRQRENKNQHQQHVENGAAQRVWQEYGVPHLF